MARSRGGLTSKAHALVDAEGSPAALKITDSQAHDGRSAADLLFRLDEDQVPLGDRAVDSDALRTRMAERGAWANVKSMRHRKQPLAFSPFWASTAICSRASSARLPTFGPSPRAATRIPTTSASASSSQQCGSRGKVYAARSSAHPSPGWAPRRRWSFKSSRRTGCLVRLGNFGST